MRIRIPRRKPKPVSADGYRRVVRWQKWNVRACVVLFDADAVWVFVTHVLLHQPLLWWATSIFCACFIVIGQSLWMTARTMDRMLAVNDDLIFQNIYLLETVRLFSNET